MATLIVFSYKLVQGFDVWNSRIRRSDQKTAQDTILIPYNNTEIVEKVFKKYGEQIAAVIVEPVAGNMGTVLPD